MNNLDLIEQLEDLKYHCQDFAEDEMEKEIQPFTDDVKALDQAINELRWIPVDDRLPTNRDYYLVCGKEKHEIGFACYNADLDVWYLSPDDMHYGDYKIIAWKPLPKPYEKK